jgi:hypothetical protein
MKLKVEIIRKTEVWAEVDGEWWTGEPRDRGKEVTLQEGVNELLDWLNEGGYAKEKRGEGFVREYDLESIGESSFTVILTDETTGDQFEF